MKTIFKLFLISAGIFMVLLNTGCNKNVEDGKICGMLDLDSDQNLLLGKAINGEELPYYSVYVDDDNYSEITRVQLSFYKDGTWDSQIFWNERVDGGYSDHGTILREGTFSCTAAGIVMEENDGDDAGILSKNTNFDVDAEWVLTSGSNEYYF